MKYVTPKSLSSTTTLRFNTNSNQNIIYSNNQTQRHMSCCHWFHPTSGGDPIWQVDTSKLKYGPGALRELHEDVKSMKLKRVVIFTDSRIRQLSFFQQVCDDFKHAQIDFAIYDQVSVEPTDISFQEAAKFATQGRFDGYISIGGGSVIDTCKAANLYATYPTTHFLDYVNAPIGRALPVPGPLKPHIACPTTCGTGSENTGIAIFDLLSMKAKTGIVSRQMRPDLAVVDPNTTLTLPSTVVACSGFDVLCHAVESYTARPHTRRTRATHASLRPASQGANPYSDVGCQAALELCGKYFVRAVKDANDVEARDKMMFASSLAGIAFGNVGCHLPHGLSYSIAGMVRDYYAKDYPNHAPIIPHGMTVIMTAPSCFQFTADACPERHLRAAELLGADIRGATPADAGDILAKQIINLMQHVSFPRGLTHVGYHHHDIPQLTDGAMPQKRLLDNAPKECKREDVENIYKGSMLNW